LEGPRAPRCPSHQSRTAATTQRTTKALSSVTQSQPPGVTRSRPSDQG